MSLGVNSSMPLFDLGTSRPRFCESRSRPELPRDDNRVELGLGTSLVSSRRDLDATERGRDVPR